MRRMATIVVGMFVGVTVWGIALAAIPDAGGVIHGCYDTKRGDLRVIDTEVGQTCERDETALYWNQTGPQGPPGTVEPQTVTASDSGVGPDPDVASDFRTVNLDCPAGAHATGSGFQTSTTANGGGQTALINDFPVDSDTWQFKVAVGSKPPEGWAFTVYLICA